MGGRCSCCYDDEEAEEDEGQARSLKGPGFNRQCTDCLWAVVFVLYTAAFIFVAVRIHKAGNVQRLGHGTDHTKHLCGEKGGLREALPKTYFPRLGEHLVKDPYNVYGVCVKACPGRGEVVQDYDSEETEWYVPLPTFSLAGRCIPFENTTSSQGTQMCAWPKCKRPEDGEEAAEPREVCGVELDGTGEAWALEAPDDWLKLGWKKEGASKGDIAKRAKVLEGITPEYQKKCKVVVRRSLLLTVDNKDAGVTERLITMYAGNFVSQAEAFYKNRYLILGFGLLGSFLLSLLVIVSFTTILRIVFPIMVFLTFAMLVVIEYIFLVQGELATGRTGRRVVSWITDSGVLDHVAGVAGAGSAVDMREHTENILQAQDSVRMKQFFAGASAALGIGILLLFCVFLHVRRQFKLLLALTNEAARTICEMPSLLLFPFINMASLGLFAAGLLWTMLGALTLDPEEAAPYFEKLGFTDLEDPENFGAAQRALMWLIIFSSLWIYFFHVAMFTTTVAATVSRWYFFRQDTENNAGTGWRSQGWYFGRSVVHAIGRVLRYHWGSLALGSLVITLITLPRLILQYIDRETKEAQESNALLKCVMRVAQCCLWCLEYVVKTLTEYTYIYIGMRGQNFCTSARQSCKLVVTYPVQVGFDQFASWMLQGLSGILVPSTMVVLSYFQIRKNWGFCALIIAGLASMVTRMAAGVYDVCISTLLLCVLYDQEHCGGIYAPESLRSVMELAPKSEIELAG
mmetsp:Transcript_69564/g.196191  ORF Transcript_69564/g.196191 Transcript_69564/m.196191 type:complete len:743 (+) Transcript_69564:126-2354(+)